MHTHTDTHTQTYTHTDIHTHTHTHTDRHTHTDIHTYLMLEVFIALWSFQAAKLALMKESASKFQPGTRTVDKSSSLSFSLSNSPPHHHHQHHPPPPPPHISGAPCGSPLSFLISLFPPSLSPSSACVAFGKLANCVLLTWVHVLSGDQLFV